ncbi:Uncharacterised protein [Klebsiella michiganensis]|nr:Uncharacterised protein [Klebsiella michiganensis]
MAIWSLISCSLSRWRSSFSAFEFTTTGKTPAMILKCAGSRPWLRKRWFISSRVGQPLSDRFDKHKMHI